MLNFRYVFNATTGERYFISSVTLTNSDGYDEGEDSVNSYSLDLQPTAPEWQPHFGVHFHHVEDFGYFIAEDLKPSDAFPEVYNEQLGDVATQIRTTRAFCLGDTLVFSGTMEGTE